MRRIRHVRPALLGVLLALAAPLPSPAADDGLLGHWRLAGDVRDSSGHGRHGVNRGADLAAPGPDGAPGGAARFDGRNAFIEVPAASAPRLGRGDFTLAVWAHTAAALDDVPGDLLSIFDPARRRGITWCVKSGGATTSQGNWRNVHFGIDAGTEPHWRDCGRPGNAVYVMALAVHAGGLYAGTCEPAAGQAGHVYRSAGGDRWEDCGGPDRCNAVTALAVHGGRLYAGVGRYRLAGSALPETTNHNLGGKVYRYEGGQQWADCGQLAGAEAVGGLLSYRGRLYASSLYRPAGFYRYREGTRWERLELPPGGERVDALAAFNGRLYAGSYDVCGVFRHDGRAWKDLGRLEPSGQTYSFEAYGGELFVGTWPNARVFRRSRQDRWVDAGRLGGEKEVMGMAVYNGKLYAGTLPAAEVFRYDGDGRWTSTGRVDTTPAVRYRRAWTMAVYRGRLYCGTLPSGHVWAMQAGACVTSDRELAPGWRHLAAVREGGHLKLYVDARLQATSEAFDPAAYVFPGNVPLRIGTGPHDHFNGSLHDLRLYGRAFPAAEIAKLARPAAMR